MDVRKSSTEVGVTRWDVSHVKRSAGSHSRPETNPPYSMVQEFIEKALTEAPHVAMLLRLNYLGSDKRARFFHRMPPDVYVLPNRPSFAKGHTDSCEYAWLVWGLERERAYGRVSVLDTTPRAERIRERREREQMAA